MKLHTRTVGNGSRTAALVHGASMSTYAWDDFIPYLLKHDLTLILVDQRGHGESPRADSYRIQDFADDLVETLPTGLDFLIGQSLGGLTAAWASERLKPKRYIGIDPALAMTPLSTLLIPLVGPVQKKMPDWMLRRLGAEKNLPNSLPGVRKQWANWDQTSLRDIKRSNDARPFPSSPPPVPSTVVLAGPSFAVRPKFADELRANGWDVRVMQGVGHDLHREDPAGLAAVLEDVLAPVPAK